MGGRPENLIDSDRFAVNFGIGRKVDNSAPRRVEEVESDDQHLTTPETSGTSARSVTRLQRSSSRRFDTMEIRQATVSLARTFPFAGANPCSRRSPTLTGQWVSDPEEREN